jgi:hypothetical protein
MELHRNITRKLTERDHLGGKAVDGRIVLKLIFVKYSDRMDHQMILR